MLTVKKARRILGKEAKNLTDDQVKEELTRLSGMCEAFFSLAASRQIKPKQVDSFTKMEV